MTCRTLGLSTLAALAVASLGAGSVLAAEPDSPPSPSSYVLRINDDEAAMSAARADVDALRALPDQSEPLAIASQQFQLDTAEYRYRDAIRAEQLIVYTLAIDQDLAAEVVPRLGDPVRSAMAQAIEGLRALWRSAGIDHVSRVRVRFNRRAGDSAPVLTLRGYYGDAGGAYGVDWSYLASINFIESDFGRDNGPSSAGALGPMQFMPPTWADYGEGGDVMSPRDAITAAAHYLSRMGAPANMSRAIFRYNNDSDYVDSVSLFAAALRTDPTWLDRLYYWSTAG